VSKTALDADMDNYFKARDAPTKPPKAHRDTDAIELARAAGQPVPEAFQDESVEDIGVLNS
jgi:hypothetical protein